MKIPSMILMTTVVGVSWLVRPRGKSPSIGVSNIVLATAATLLATAAPALAKLPTPVSAATARSYLASLKVEPEIKDPRYNRSLFPHWAEISGACNTRKIVLKRDGTNVVTNRQCAITSGTWYSPYDDNTMDDPSDVDIDHVVALKEAWVSGAHLWTDAQRAAFSNDLIQPQLVAVTDDINKAKGSKDPSTWLPPRTSFHCTYLRAWVQVKHHYGLSVDSTEKRAIARRLENC
ncbi:hypothetical protein BGZ92_009143 [Podila epicladia]|nr:hypothetical protein BGZ92_009143 [Podila epicladia]